jgi:hypothetical protein
MGYRLSYIQNLLFVGCGTVVLNVPEHSGGCGLGGSGPQPVVCVLIIIEILWPTMFTTSVKIAAILLVKCDTLDRRPFHGFSAVG